MYSMPEFDLINRIFKASVVGRDHDVVMGIGDDAAVIRVPAKHELLVSTDTLVSGIHFHHDMPAHAVGYKSLAVNLSDMAAMGATPAWATLAITHPDGDTQWLESFAQGFAELARQHQVELVGGDTTAGPLSISVTIMGFARPEHVVYRDGAKADDLIIVTGELGAAAAELRRILARNSAASAKPQPQPQPQPTVSALSYPQPRVQFMRQAAAHMHAAIDISDGLAADLHHLLSASGVGAQLDLAALPIAGEAMRADPALALQDALYGGDDYEILFTCSEEQYERITRLDAGPTSNIGRITATHGLRGKHPDEADYRALPIKGYQHFG